MRSPRELAAEIERLNQEQLSGAWLLGFYAGALWGVKSERFDPYTMAELDAPEKPLNPYSGKQP